MAAPVRIFDALRFLKEHFNSPDGLILLLNRYGEHHPPRSTVLKWWERKSIPGEWLAVCVTARELETGKPISLMPYIDVKNVCG